MRNSTYIGAASLLLLSLTGCEERQPIPNKAGGSSSTQSQLDRMDVGCRDGVQYLYKRVDRGAMITPRLKPDGMPYTC